MNYQVKMCEFGSQDSHHSPWKGLPQLAPWHHVGATMEITLDKNWIIIVIRQELSPVTCNQPRTCLQVHIHGQWMLPSLMHSFVGQSSIRELSPCIIIIIRKGEDGRKKKREVLHLFRCYTHTRTHIYIYIYIHIHIIIYIYIYIYQHF